MIIVIQPYICYFVYKQSLSKLSSDCNEFHIKFHASIYGILNETNKKLLICRSSRGTSSDLSA